MDKREILKSMLHNLINDKPEEATLDFHNYITPKTREVAGIGAAPAAQVPADAPADGGTE
jgi:hypothetical protein